MKIDNDPKLLLTNQKGQSFIEFVLLLVMLIGISYGLLAGINGNVAKRWKALVSIIVKPTDSSLALRGE
ncbi:MAG: hypothetical protein ACJAT2_003405 [Bacteriovoracaceae bacterium]|jgi:hypothetical protein